jgi:hypothetical protein
MPSLASGNVVVEKFMEKIFLIGKIKDLQLISDSKSFRFNQLQTVDLTTP